MKKVIQINSFNAGSTGKIARAINQEARDAGWETYFFYGREWKHSKPIPVGEKISSVLGLYFHGVVSRIFDNVGLLSRLSTRRLLRRIDKIHPDIVHLHNIHGYYLNYPMLFAYLETSNIPVVWTLHDCWSFTGHCVYFDFAKCEKWRNGCFNCPQKKTYPSSYVLDRSRQNYRCKRQSFSSVNNLTIVPVSNWLGGLVQQSLLKDADVHVIHNGIDINIFTEKRDSNTSGKPYVLGVASPWSKRKGLFDFIKLREKLDCSIDIKLIGLTESQIASLPSGIIGIAHTNSVDEMVSEYSNAIAYINLTYEDNFPTTNIEALSCGTPVITYKTGGSPEAIDSYTGFVINQGDVPEVVRAIECIIGNGKETYSSACRKRAVEKYSSVTQYKKYIEMYEKILKNYCR